MGLIKKDKKSMAELTAGYEQFIKGKEVNANNGQLFEKAIKKAVKPKSKQRGSK